jgi:hypothetical protein
VIYPSPTQHKITDSDGIKQHQYNTLAHCRVQLAEQHYTNVGATHYHAINLFGIGCPKKVMGTPNAPLSKHCNKKAKHVRRRYIKEEEDDERDDHYNIDNDDNNGDDEKD